MNSQSHTSKAVLIIVMICGLVLLFWGKLGNISDAGIFALIYVGAIINRLDSRRQGYKAQISAAGVTANFESLPEPDEVDAQLKAGPGNA